MTPHPRPLAPSRPVGLVAALALALALVVGLLPGLGAPAGAHDGDAVIVVESTHPAGLQVHYIVRVTWADDGHPAEDATVTATAVAADGTQVTPVTLAPADSDGRYSGALEYPSEGAWTLRVTSIEPTGKIEQPQTVIPLPPTTASGPTNEVSTSPDGEGTGDDAGDTGEGGDNGFAPADDGTGSSEDAATDPATGESGDDSGMPIYLLVALAAVVVIGAVTAVSLIRRNRQQPDGTGSPGDGDGDGTAPGEPVAGGGTPSTVAVGGDGAPASGTGNGSGGLEASSGTTSTPTS
jgi:hypothetical protein